MPGILLLCLLLLLNALPVGAAAPADRPHAGELVHLNMPDADIRVQFQGSGFRLSRSTYIDWLQTAANAVAAYYHQFPVKRLLVKVEATQGQDIGFSTTDFQHGEGEIEIPVGDEMTAQDLKGSWVAAHEMTHLAFPIVYHHRRWVAEGQATYIEPLARLQIGDLSARQVWGDLVEHLPSGLKEGSSGLNGSDSIARVYWGGALFFLLADLEIRKKTHNQRGLQDALSGIVEAGGNARADWSVEEAFAAGDRAVGLHVLRDLDAKMSESAYPVDLQAIWSQLGIRRHNGTVEFEDGAPLSAVRKAIERGH